MSVAPMPAAKKSWTQAELEALPEDGYIHEVVNGELVMSPKNNFEHESIFNRLFLTLGRFNQEHRLGIVRGSGAGFWMQNRKLSRPRHLVHSQSAASRP